MYFIGLYYINFTNKTITTIVYSHKFNINSNIIDLYGRSNGYVAQRKKGRA